VIFVRTEARTSCAIGTKITLEVRNEGPDKKRRFMPRSGFEPVSYSAALAQERLKSQDWPPKKKLEL